MDGRWSAWARAAAGVLSFVILFQAGAVPRATAIGAADPSSRPVGVASAPRPPAPIPPAPLAIPTSTLPIRWSFNTGIADGQFHNNLDDSALYSWSSKWQSGYGYTSSTSPSMQTNGAGPGGYLPASPGDSFAVEADLGQSSTRFTFIKLEIGFFNSGNAMLKQDGNTGTWWIEVGRSYAQNGSWAHVSNVIGPAPRNTHHIHLRVNYSTSRIDNLVVVRAVPSAQVYGTGAYGHAVYPVRLEAEPVNTAIGNYVSSVTDLALPGRGLNLAFQRTYNSLDTSAGVLGVGWRHAYEARLAINADGSRRFYAEDGAQLLFWANGLGGYIRPAGAFSTLAPFGGGYELTRRDQVRYRFDSAGVLTAILDRNNNQLSFTYTAGKLTSISDTVGRGVTLAYDGNGRLASISGPPSRSVSYTYDGSGRLSTVSDLRGKVTTYTYDASSRLATIVDANGRTVVTNEYNVDGRISAQTDARGKRGTFAWNIATQTATFSDARGGTWTDVYSANVLQSHANPLGHTTTFAYDNAFNVTGVTDPNARTTTFTYDANANLLTRTAPAPLSYLETWTYTARNDVATYRDGRSNLTSFDYDAAGNLIRITAPLSSITQFGRDPGATGLLVSLTDPRGKVTTYGYDAQANRTSVTTPLANVTTMTYDVAGRLLTSVEPRGNVQGADPAQYTTTYAYDAADHLLSVTDPLSGVTTYIYDDVGNQTSVVDASGRSTAFAYDAANNLSSVTDARNGITAYAYDDVANLITRTDANNRVTTYAYNLAKRLTSITDPLTHVWAMTYDNAGNLATRTDANTKTTTFAYDVLNRLTSITYADPSTPTVTYAYDANGNRTAMTDGAGSESYAYDALNRLTAVTRGTDTFSYGYDLAANLTSRTYPGQAAQTLAYDDDGRLTSANGASYAYDAASNLLTAATPDGLTARSTYDRAGRLLEVAHTTPSGTLSRFTYALDAAGNRTAMTTVQGTVTYRHDELYRLTEACWSSSSCPGGPPAAPLACLACIGGPLTRPAPSVNPPPGETFRTYTYDPVGNRLSEGSEAGATTYLYDAADRLISRTAPGGGVTSYTFDNNGNQTGAGATTFTYDLADRLQTATVGGTTETYTYAGDGTRLSASTGAQPAQTTKFLWDRGFGLPQLAIERDGSDGLLRSYRYGLDLLSQTAGSSTYHYHHDGLGSVVDVTDPTGSSLTWSEYYPYGIVRQAGSGAGAPAAQPFGFTGEQLDTVTGLYHLRARQYDAGIGRFLTTDPVAPPISDPFWASYLYARDNPVLLIDPSGENPCAAAAAAFVGGPVTGAVAIVFCIAVAGLLLSIAGTSTADAPPMDVELPSLGIPPHPPEAQPAAGPAPVPTFAPFPNAYEETHPDLYPDLVGRQSSGRGCGDSKTCKGLVAALILAILGKAITSEGKIPHMRPDPGRPGPDPQK